ncbi:MAG: polysaccharide biosynthesis tyrosine autokinase [Gammaproteobacteria bacterium]|nr:polysaccharide biosynthesis tyrosine autokinase [Gammaproteobacteria bacterium]
MSNSVTDPDILQNPLEEVIDLREYWSVIKRHRVSITLICFITVILATLVAFSMEPVYKSAATLLIETEGRKVVSIEEVYTGGQQSREYLNTQFEVIKSQALARKVINQLDLLSHPYFLPEADAGENETSLQSLVLGLLPDTVSAWFIDITKLDDSSVAGIDDEEFRIRELLEVFSELMLVSPVRNTQLVHISFEATDSKLAALLANTMAQAYISDQLDARLEMTSQANSWLTQRLSTIREKLKNSEEALQKYKEKEKLIESGSVTGLISRQLEDLNVELLSAQKTLNSLAAARAQISNITSKKYQDYLSIPAVLEDELISQLIKAVRDAEQGVDSLKMRYGHRHPKMVSAKASLNAASNALKNHVLSVVNGIERQYQLALSAEESAQRSMAITKTDIHKITSKKHRLGILEREAQANRQLYELFLNRIKETTESTGIDQANARIVDMAFPAIQPIKPQKRLIVIIAGFLGLGFGILLAFLFEHFDNTVKSALQIEERFKMVVLGVLPKMSKKTKDIWQQVKLDSKSTFSEGIRTIRTGVILSNLDNSQKTILVTSCLPSEGKTSVTINTAINLSKMHKVVLIDADMRKPSVGKLLGFERNVSGLAELITKTDDPSNCIHRWGEQKLHVIPTGHPPPNPLELLSSKAFKDMLEHMQKAFDYVIIDSPPVLPVSDARLISTLVNGVVFVIKADDTPIPLVNDSLKSLRQSGAAIMGAVLNQFDVHKHNKSNKYGGYSYVKGYYSESYGG